MAAQPTQTTMMIKPSMSVDEFAAKWRNAAPRERANSQTHFNDLCAVLDVATPVEEDPSGESYTFEKHVDLPGGGSGDADVWKRGHFGWEYKSGGKSLSAAYEQLLGYREGLENPPLLVVCDMNRFEIHTNFTNTEPRVIEFTLKHLEENPTHYIRLLREVFLDPEALHPNRDPRYITETAAAKFGEVAEALRERDGHDPALVARFLNRIIFCFFAESVGLYRNLRGAIEKPVTDVFDNMSADATLSKRIVGQLFEAMAERDVRNFGAYYIRWFNGGLFDETAVPETLQLTGDLAQIINETAELNWSRVDPAIFGTLFERGLDPKRRSQLGAHYTDPDNIMRVVEPVALRPPAPRIRRAARRTRARTQARRRAAARLRREQRAGFRSARPRLPRRAHPRLPPTPRGGARARPRLRLRQLPLHRNARAEKPRTGTDRVGAAPGRQRLAAPHRPPKHARHRYRSVRRRPHPYVALDRLHPVEHRAKHRHHPRPRPRPRRANRMPRRHPRRG